MRVKAITQPVSRSPQRERRRGLRGRRSVTQQTNLGLVSSGIRPAHSLQTVEPLRSMRPGNPLPRTSGFSVRHANSVCGVAGVARKSPWPLLAASFLALTNHSAHQQEARYGRVPANLATSHIIICGAITATIDSGKTQRRRQKFIVGKVKFFFGPKCTNFFKVGFLIELQE